MEKTYYIYCWKNRINGKKYIGQTTDLYTRKSNHLKDAQFKNTPFCKALREFGPDNFSFEILEECLNLEQVNDREVFHIRTENSLLPDGYNTSLVSNHMSQEIKDKIAVSNKERWAKANPETRIKWLKSVEKASEVRKGGTSSEYQRSQARKANQREWLITYPTGEQEKITNLTAFCKLYNIGQGNMVKVADGILKQAKGFKCERLNEKKKNILDLPAI